MSNDFHVHLVSDATGETLNAIAKAALAQFEGVEVEEHSYVLVRSRKQLGARGRTYRGSSQGLVFFTLVNPELRKELVARCAAANLPCLDVMEGPIAMMRQFLGAAETHRPGAQHEVDQRYLQRIEALNFTIQHDDGQALDTIDDAEVILVGASRTSKTPTCVYLAIRGVRAANVPLVPGMRAAAAAAGGEGPADRRACGHRPTGWCRCGATGSTRWARCATPTMSISSAVRDEVTATRKLFEQQDWPVIDVSRRSVEETAAAVINLLNERRGQTA